VVETPISKSVVDILTLPSAVDKRKFPKIGSVVRFGTADVTLVMALRNLLLGNENFIYASRFRFSAQCLLFIIYSIYNHNKGCANVDDGRTGAVRVAVSAKVNLEGFLATVLFLCSVFLLATCMLKC
jgi:hypothetical protein